MHWPVDRFKEALHNIGKLIRAQSGEEDKAAILREGKEILAEKRSKLTPLISS